MNVPTIEQSYQKYLSLVKLPENKMPPIQRREIKQAFFAGFGMALLTLRDDVGGLEDVNESVEAMNDLIKQVDMYFLNLSKN